MNIATLKNLIQTTPWFSTLGQPYRPKEKVISVSGEQWTPFISALTEAEFGLLHDRIALETFPFADFDWLPTTIYDDDPVHKERLVEKARLEGREKDFKAVRVEIFRLTQVALRSASAHPLLVVGPTDTTGAARGGALFACRAAAAELLVDQPGFWCDIILLYHAGHWPFGRMKSGEVVIL